jgi:hypothetical protein
MKLMEVKEGIVDVQSDEFHQAKKADTRRPRLTLLHLSKLRKMREIRNMEMEQRKDMYATIYARPPAPM